jgi:hypothetical protein
MIIIIVVVLMKRLISRVEMGVRALAHITLFERLRDKVVPVRRIPKFRLGH